MPVHCTAAPMLLFWGMHASTACMQLECFYNNSGGCVLASADLSFDALHDLVRE